MEMLEEIWRALGPSVCQIYRETHARTSTCAHIHIHARTPAHAHSRTQARRHACTHVLVWTDGRMRMMACGLPCAYNVLVVVCKHHQPSRAAQSPKSLSKLRAGHKCIALALCRQTQNQGAVVATNPVTQLHVYKSLSMLGASFLDVNKEPGRKCCHQPSTSSAAKCPHNASSQ